MPHVCPFVLSELQGPYVAKYIVLAEVNGVTVSL